MCDNHRLASRLEVKLNSDLTVDLWLTGRCERGEFPQVRVNAIKDISVEPSKWARKRGLEKEPVNSGLQCGSNTHETRCTGRRLMARQKEWQCLEHGTVCSGVCVHA